MDADSPKILGGLNQRRGFKTLA